MTEAMKMIEEHLQTVFVKVTPQYQTPSTGMPGQIRSAELRREDLLQHLMLRPDVAWPRGSGPAITC